MADEYERGADAPEGEAPDYKALWERERAHSREWEKRAKANKAAADELERAREAGRTADERISELERRLSDAERADARRKVAAKVAKEKGVPADLLVGEDEKSMAEWADRLKAALGPRPAPNVGGAGSFDRGGTGDDELRGFARRLVGNED